MYSNLISKMIFLLSLMLMLGYSTFSQSIQEVLKTAEILHNSNPDSSYLLCVEAEKTAISQNDAVGIASSKLGKVRYLVLKNRLEEASKELELAAMLFQENNHKSGLGRTYVAMANIAGRIRKKEVELDYLERANQIFTDVGDTLSLVKSLTNLSLKYTSAGKLTEAENSLNLLESLSEWMPEKDFYYVHQNWGIFYHEKRNYAAALHRFEIARSIAFKLNMIDSQSTILLMIGKIKRDQKLHDRALSPILQSIEVARINNLIMEEMEALDVLYTIYEEKGDIPKAFEAYKRMTAIKDTVFNLEKVNKLNAYERTMAISEKQNIIALQNLELERQKTQLLKDKIRIYFLFAILIMVIISVAFLIININNKKKANRVIQAKKDEVEVQKNLIENKNKEITDSINYAKRIQEAILPSKYTLFENLGKGFVLFKPKDIVSGDFYWLEKENETIYFAAADCTGHGVPGAMVSVMCSNALTKAVKELGIFEPGKILDKAAEILEERFAKSEEKVNDGMDIALCRLDLTTKKLEYSGANNSLCFIREGELQEIKADKQPIGKFENRQAFTNHTIQLQKDDIIYIFSDGFADQFGGPKGKKFKYSQLKELLLANVDKPMDGQKDILDNAFEDWKGDLEQVDDVCIIGVRI